MYFKFILIIVLFSVGCSKNEDLSGGTPQGESMPHKPRCAGVPTSNLSETVVEAYRLKFCYSNEEELANHFENPQ